jgi:hypothetical protein
MALCKLGLFVASLLVFASSPRDCLRNTLQQYDRSAGLKFVPGPDLRGHGVRRGIESVYLTLEVGTNIGQVTQMAKILSQGRPHEAILQKLVHHLQTQKGKPLALRELLPDMPKKLSATFSKCEGPNCLNATLNWHDPKTGVRHVPAKEIEDALKSKYKKLEPGEKLVFGDVLVIKYRSRSNPPKDHIQHTAIYLDDNLVWHKASRSELDPWTFETMESTLYPYFYDAEEAPLLEFYRYK